jgi:DNA replication and repair protein RecF
MLNKPEFFAPSITRLRLVSFRSYVKADCQFGSGINILTGANGVGKTNILEAVSLLGSGRGLRSANLNEIMNRDGELGWSVRADMALSTGPSDVRVSYAGDARKLSMDGDVRPSFESLTASLPQLWLTPAMDRLFLDGASGRRKFMDRFTLTLVPGFGQHASAFEKAMRERNKLLSDENWSGHRIWLDSLEDTMAIHAVAIAAGRLNALDALAEGLSFLPETNFPQSELALDGELEAALRSQAALDVEDKYREQLLANRALDAGAGRTLRGPHRSDFLVHNLDKNMPASQCSTGEQKALLVGLILAQAHCVASRTSEVPLLLLDEIAAHMDAHRRSALADVLGHLGGQVWITGTDTDSFRGFQKNTTHVFVEDGAATPQSTGADVNVDSLYGSVNIETV